MFLRKTSPFDVLYIDYCDVHRNIEADDGYGGTVETESIVIEKQKCRLSQKSISATSNNDGINTSTQEFRLFFPKEVEIKQNDKLVVTRDKQKYTGRASLPFKYTLHQEIVLKDVVENGD